MTDPINQLLPHLEGVKRTSQGRYIARCPAHGDRHPSLAIRELDDGAVLLHCFAGCSADEVVGAVGLEIGDLFPPRSPDGRKPERKPFNANDVLVLAAWESLVASIIAGDVAKGNLDDVPRLRTAAGRLQHIAEVAGARN